VGFEFRALMAVFSAVFRALFSAVFTVIAMSAAGCKPATTAAVPALTDVGIVIAAPSSLPITLSYTGHTAGSRQVEVRARVSGILLARRFEEGKPVTQDQILFQLDPEPARAGLAQAQAELALQRAQVAQAERESARIVAMAAQGLVSQLQRDQAMSATEIAGANRLAAEARLRKAELDLSYTQVRAPIAGLASNEARSEGSLVTAGTESSLLTRIVQADPLYVEFTVPDSEAATLRAGQAANLTTGLAKTSVTTPTQPMTVHIELADGTQYAQPAQLTFLDNAIEMQSGSVAARAIVRNPDHALLPGQFVRVRIEGLRIDNVIGLPRKAVLTNGEGHFVWVLDEQNKATQRHLTLGANIGDLVIVKNGLERGDRVVIDGVMKVAAGERVNIPMPALAGASSTDHKHGSSLVKSIE